MESFERPSSLLQLQGQPIEKFWMARQRTTESKVAGCGDDPFPEMMVPQSIDDYPCWQWVLFRANPLGEPKTPLCVGLLSIQASDRR